MSDAPHRHMINDQGTILPLNAEGREIEEDERQYIVDSGASYHLVALGDLTGAERRTIRKGKRKELCTANCDITINQICTFKMHNYEQVWMPTSWIGIHWQYYQFVYYAKN